MIDIAVNASDSETRQAWWSRSLDADVTGWLLVGTTEAESSQLAAAELAPGQRFTAGVHPHHAADNVNWDTLRQIWQTPECAAVGECGLDFFRMISTQADQLATLDRQIQGALEANKPLYLHDREASETLAPRIENLALPRVVHCFTGTEDALERYLAAGCYIGITAWFLDERRGQDLKALIPRIPLDRLMIETDAPYLAPRTMRPRPKRNEPAFLAHTAEHLAELLAIDLAALVRATRENAEHVFGKFA